MRSESDCNGPYAAAYACTFPAMIRAWRSAWTKGTAVRSRFVLSLLQMLGDILDQE